MSARLYRAEGVVLRTIRLGEADRIVTLCTRERGKVRAVAKGVRKTKSKFGGRLEPISHVAVQCYEGRELDIITQADSIETFRSIREDFDRMRRAVSMLEAVDSIVQEGEANPRLHQMLVGALRSLDQQDSPLVLASFYWKLLALDGVQPMLDQCASCGATEDLVAFDINEGGVLCRSCRQGLAISPDALALLRRTLGGDLARVLQEPAGEITYELEHLADESIEHHLERRLRSRRVLDRA
jgi:DNA repair protein RecO (recombination protein O)